MSELEKARAGFVLTLVIALLLILSLRDSSSSTQTSANTCFATRGAVCEPQDFAAMLAPIPAASEIADLGHMVVSASRQPADLGAMVVAATRLERNEISGVRLAKVEARQREGLQSTVVLAE